MGIVSLLLSLDWTADGLAVYINTTDDRYLLLRFTHPLVEVVV